MPVSTTAESRPLRIAQFLELTKPRVVSLIVFTALIGMFLATDRSIPLDVFAFAVIGIWLVAGAAAAINCVVEHKIDALMARTDSRPIPSGSINVMETLVFAILVGGCGLLILFFRINPLTMWLTLATFVGYAILYTLVLKPLTPQNIVIGGASGAMPPILGWAAVTGDVTYEPLLLFLIIFAWTPPHFWALALYRRDEYAKANVPMLPVTHGPEFTRIQLLLYTIILTAVTFLPFATKMSGYFYFVSVLFLDLGFLWLAIRLYRSYSDNLARWTFRYSIFYLTALFFVLLVDHQL